MATRILIAPWQAVGFRRMCLLRCPQTFPTLMTPAFDISLDISPRTAQKHLERIYARLGVEYRHAAITIVLEKSGSSRLT